MNRGVWVGLEFCATPREETLDKRSLVRVGLARNSLPPEAFDPSIIGWPTGRDRSFCEHAGCFHECRIVEQYERRPRRVGSHPGGSAFLSRWCIKGKKLRVEKHPLPVNVEAPSPLAAVCISFVLSLRKIQVLVVACRPIRMHANAAELLNEQAADIQDSVSHALCGQSPAALLSGSRAKRSAEALELWR